MKINGIGVDIVENNRLKKLIKNKQFISRIFSQKEIDKSKKIKNKTNYFSKRFAAKEALSKAIGTGFRKGLNFKDISIINDKYGKPNYELNSNVKKFIYSKFNVKKIKISLSLADEKKYSIAFSVIHK
jgi:holo-[acyl-carrier protein] synthase